MADDFSEEEVIEDLTVAMHFDSNTHEYEIQLSSVQLTHLDLKNNIVRLKVPSHRLQRIKTPTYNAEAYVADLPIKSTRHNGTISTPIHDDAYQSDHDNLHHDDHDDEDDEDEHMEHQLNHQQQAAILDDKKADDEEQNAYDHDYKSNEPEIEILNNEHKRSELATPKRPANINANVEIKALKKHVVVKEWKEICKKYPLYQLDPISTEVPVITKQGCFSRIIFILKYYTRWILYKDKHFKSQKLPKNEDFLSITSLFNALEGYDKIKLLNDYYWLLSNVMLPPSSSTENKSGSSRDIEELILNNSNILQCDYCLNRLNNRNAELYNVKKLSVSLRRDLYFINESNEEIKADTVEERVEIGIQQYLDVLYCSLLYPNNMSDGLKFTMNIEDSKQDDDSKKDDMVEPAEHLFGEYFTYWKAEHLQYCRAKYADLKAELLSNTIYAIDEKDYFCLYNRAKDFLLSISGRQLIAKRTKLHSKVRQDQRLQIGHIVALTLYCSYYHDFVGERWIKLGCMKRDENEKFGAIRLRNNEIANWCKLLNEAIFCWGNQLNGDERLYYNVNKRVSFNVMSVEFNRPISCTSSFLVARKFHAKYGGIMLRLGKFEASKEYNFSLNLAFWSAYPLQHEFLIYGGKFEINDIIYSNQTHYNDIQSFKLYLQIMKGRWFSHNKLIFKKQYEKKLISLITRFLDDGNTDHNDDDHSDEYMQLLFNKVVASNGTSKKQKTIYINSECDKLLPDLKKLVQGKLVPYLLSTRKSAKDRVSIFKKGYNTVVSMKLAYSAINASSFNKSLYSSEYKYQLLYLKNNRPQEIVFHFRCYKKYDAAKKKFAFKGCFEIKQLPQCVSKCKMIGGLLVPQIQFEKWDFITLSHAKLYSGSSLFDMQRIKNFDSLLLKIAFQVKEVIDTDDKLIPTIDL